MIRDDSHPRWKSADEADLSEDPRIAEVVAEYQRELESGKNPDRNEFINRYPELASAVTDCLDGLQILFRGVHRVKSQVHPFTDFAGRSLDPLLGDFKVVRELARGGMGVVYEAEQVSLGRRVALKVLPFAATLDSRQLQRFKNEAQAAALLHHSNIVPIYAVGCERGVHFYAMQLIEGQSLAVVVQQLRSRTGLKGRESSLANSADDDQTASWTSSGEHDAFGDRGSVSQNGVDSTAEATHTLTNGLTINSEGYFRRIAALMIQAAQALDHAHQLGVVHRDIKPGNLLVDIRGGLWITDFGLAQLQTDHGLTCSGDLLGTLRYMSPEQASGQRTAIDHRADIYSLGATFYELLTLEPLFSSDSHQELLYQILNTEPHTLRHWNPTVPVELETIVLKALSKFSADRYQSAADLAADLQRFLDHEPIRARRPSLGDRLRKWARRHPAVVIAGALLLLVVTAGSLLSIHLLAREQQKTAAALEREKTRANEVEQRFQQARQAVDALFQISEEEMIGRPMDGARKRILEVVLGHYQDFIEQRQGDPTSQSELAAVQDKVKNILHELNVLDRDMHTRLLTNKAVQAELGLTREQQFQLESLLDEWSKQRRESFIEIRTQSDDPRRKQIVVAAEERERQLAHVLTASQLQRFKQIGIQSLGLMAFKDPEIVEKLELSREQRIQVRDVERELLSDIFGRIGDGKFRNRGPDHSPLDAQPKSKTAQSIYPSFDVREAFLAHHEQAFSKLLTMLNPEQLRRWSELTGKPFTDFGEERFPLPPPPGF